MKTLKFSERMKFAWGIIKAWLLTALVLIGLALIFVTPFYADGYVVTLSTFAGLGCIISGLGGLHG